jgi:hypothetical protein
MYECRWGVPPPAYVDCPSAYFFFFAGAFLAGFFVAMRITSLR